MVSILQAVGFITLAWSKATELSKDGLATFLKENENVLVKFYAPWCGHCKKMAPEFDDAADRLEGKTALAKVDVDNEDNKPLMGEYGISGFPTLKFFRNGEVMDYTGGRTADEIVSWIENITGPAMVEVENRDSILKDYAGSSILAYCGSMTEKENTYTLFKKTAEANRGKFVYAAYKCDKPRIELIRRDGSSTDVEGAETEDDIISFAQKNRLGYFEAIGPENAKDYFESGLKIVFFGGTEEDYNKYEKVGATVGKKFRDTYLITYIDIEKWKQQAEGMMRTTQFPSFVIPEEVGMFQLADESKFTEAGVSEWLQNVVDGKIEAELQSEDIPETNDEPIKVVVGQNFTEMVTDDKDVFLEIHASWCGVCKQFRPIFEEFAEKMQTLSPNTLIAALDGSVNEIPVLGYPFTGFPTLFFKKAEGEPELYSGERTVEAMIEFIKTNGTNKFAEESAGSEKDEL